MRGRGGGRLKEEGKGMGRQGGREEEGGGSVVVFVPMVRVSCVEAPPRIKIF